MNILLSSAGRRIGLARCLLGACERIGLSGSRLIAADASRDAPAAAHAHASHRVPRCTEPGFVDAILALCEKERIGLIVPTIDTELGVYAAVKDRFAALGVRLAVSSPEAVAIADDKRATNAWLRAGGFPVPGQTTPARALAERWRAPLIVKPVVGSGSVGLRRLEGRDELAALAKQPGDWVVETIAPGEEYTVHIFVNTAGKCETAVPCRRVEVRAGEVSKACTRRIDVLIETARRIGEALPGAYGPLNVQCFLDGEARCRVIEINARFGGGYPLVDRAGASFVQHLIEDAAGLSPSPIDGWEDGLAMLRFDEAVFLSAAEAGWEQRCERQGAARAV